MKMKSKNLILWLYKSLFLFLTFFFVLTLQANNVFSVEAQNKPITGKVLDSDSKEPLIGVSIMIKGTSQGTTTNLDGVFTLDVSEGALIVVSYVGYNEREIEIAKTNDLVILLKEEEQLLDELVVVGYGTQRKGSVTGSVSSIQTDEIIKAPVADLSNSLGGKLPGLRVVTRSGEPGWNSSEIDIRGFGSALVIVDGVPGSFTQIDPNEVESISILKDASAAVYGIQAANGVILITTKKGSSSRTKINFNTTFSWQRPTIYPKMVNAAQFVELTDEDNINRGKEPLYGPDQLEKWKQGGIGFESTDWYNEIIRSYSPQQQYNVNIQGGSEQIKHFTSFGYLNQEGMWKSGANNFNRFNFRTNIDANIIGGLSASIMLSGRKEKRISPASSVAEIMSTIQRIYPTMKPYANNNKDYFAITNVPMWNPSSASGKDTQGYYRGVTKVFDGSFALNYDASEFVKGLSAKVMYHYRTSNQRTKNFKRKYQFYSYNEAEESYDVAYTGNMPPSLRVRDTEYQNKIFQGSLNYDNTFAGKHAVSTLFLLERRQNSDNWLEAYREFIIDSIDEINAGVNENKDSQGTSSESANIGYIGRLNYAYDNKYLFEFSFRYDGSSKYAPGNRWGFFPSVSLGWRITQEPFMQDKVDFIDDLKIRGSWGKLGDDSGVGAYQYLSGYTYPSGSYILGDKVISGLVSRGLPNPNITWYKSELYNFGLEYVLWNRMLYGEFDVFYRKRTGLLATRSISLPGTFGAGLPQENLNSDSDRGYELVLGHQNSLSNGVKYSVRTNVSYTRSKMNHVERTPSANQYKNWRDNTSNRWKNISWGYNAIGQFKSYEEIAHAPIHDGKGNTTIKPGDIKYLDYNGDGVIDDNDVHVIGRGNKPEIMYGIDISAEWKGVDFSIFMQGAANFCTFFNEELQSPLFNGASAYRIFMDRWHRKDLYDSNSEWIPGKYPSTYSGGTESNRRFSTFWLKSANYFRIKEIQLGYTLPKEVTNKMRVDKLRVFFSGYNLFTFTGLKNLDPEVPEGRGRYYPQQKILSIGLNLTL